MGLFITFEGIEGCGKTTQLRRLATVLRDAARPVLVTREPGGCPIADAIRAILLDRTNQLMAPRTELLLYAAARAQHVEEIIVPALAEGQIVLCDRFSDATVAYQGYGRGLAPELIVDLNAFAAGSLVPDLTVLLDFPPEIGLDRARRRNSGSSGPDESRFEEESLEFHRRVRDGYLALAKKHQRFRVVDAQGSEDQVAARIRTVVAPLLGGGI